jgi:hypothetical protein
VPLDRLFADLRTERNFLVGQVARQQLRPRARGVSAMPSRARSGFLAGVAPASAPPATLRAAPGCSSRHPPAQRRRCASLRAVHVAGAQGRRRWRSIAASSTTDLSPLRSRSAQRQISINARPRFIAGQFARPSVGARRRSAQSPHWRARCCIHSALCHERAPAGHQCAPCRVIRSHNARQVSRRKQRAHRT